MSNIVFGGGPSAVRVAAVLSDCKLLEPTAHLGGIVEPQMPEGAGSVPSTSNSDIVRTFYGQSHMVGKSYIRGLWALGRCTPLPVTPLSVKGLVSNFEWGALMAGHLRLRGERLVRSIRGGGSEERTYRDWVVHRFGEGAYRGLHAPYAKARWGEPSEISHAFAERFHGGEPSARVFLGASPADGWDNLVGKVSDFRLNTGVKGLRFTDGRVSHVAPSSGRSLKASSVWYTGSLPKLFQLLPAEIGAPLKSDMNNLKCRDRVQISLNSKDDLQGIPDELHIIGGGTSIFMATKLSSDGSKQADRLTLHLSLPSGRQVSDDLLVAEVVGMCSSLGLPRLSVEAPWIRRYIDYDPAWVGSWHPVHTRVMLKLEELGIRLVGRSASYRHMDPAEELSLVTHAVNAESVHESIRLFGDTPVVHDYDNDNSKLDSFVMR